MLLFLFLFFSMLLYTMLIFQTKILISNEKWFNCIDSLFFFFEKAKHLGRSHNGGLSVMIKNINE